MSMLTMLCYLVGGHHVGDIADEMGTDRATVRGVLKDWGISIKPTASGYALGRDSVSDAARRAGYGSFHGFAQVKGLAPITEQATELGVSEKALAKVYNAYRRLLESLKASGVTLPTSQTSGDSLDRPTRDYP